MLHLPLHPSRECITAFWLALTLVSSLITALLLYVPFSPQVSAVGFAAIPVLFLPILLWAKGLMICYRVWNRLAREISRFARNVILLVYFYVVFVAARFGGSSMTIDRVSSNQSLWITRKAVESTACFGQYKSSAESSSKNWLMSICSWTLKSGDLLPLCLLPFLLLLRALEPKKETEVPADIYTLY